MQRVLVVDDDKVIRDVLSTMLMTIGFGVDVASSGDEGLNLFRK
ncbi:MAG: DNA-binding response regulator, partial [Proteobacteria bacterium]|nr:DNA-binding response regulator [Pseudomonadota bacterium]